MLITRTPVAATSPRAADEAAATTAAQKVVIVNGSPEILEVLETILDAGQYDVVFVQSNEHAYSQIKQVRPELVILCVRTDRFEGFQVLSMLKLDDETRQIPVLTYAIDDRNDETPSKAPEPSDAEIFGPRPVELKH